MRFATHVGAYEIDSVPSQPQVAHCHAFFVPIGMRGKGLAHDLKTNQNMVLSALGYDFATCTVCGNNAAQKRVLTKAGWSMIASFVSSKNGDPVELWGWQVVSIGDGNRSAWGHGDE